MKPTKASRKNTQHNPFLKWLILSLIFGLVGLFAVLNIENLAWSSGSVNRQVLLAGISVVVVLVLASVVSLLRANFVYQKKHVIISAFASILPIGVFIMNTMLYIVWFGGK
ncbi:MAG TPA: hypothetical protein DHN33_04920 [Eubacteriaceae bacterium]|nr:hypothetical protein [Eubacteriaceae bacterium]